MSSINKVSGNPRGRPKTSSKKGVPEKLSNATEELLRDSNLSDITERRIAATAGVNEGMIHYYYGDKNGLLFHVVSRYLDSATKIFESISTDSLPPRAAIRLIIKTLIAAYYNKPWIARYAVSEMAIKGSPIREAILERYGLAGDAVDLLTKHISKRVSKGEYKCDTVQLKRTSAALIMLIGAPLSLKALPIHSSMNFEEYMSDEWVDYLADLFDSYLRQDPQNT